MKTLTERFEEFHANNPHVYELFKQFAQEAISVGRDHLSAEMLVHRIRWESVIKTVTRDYKINNNYAAFYGRLFARDFPEHRYFFRTRRSVADATLTVAA
jgi:hypothetical protein